MSFVTRFLAFAALLAPVALFACSGSDEPAGTSVKPDLAGFDGYCTGTLLKEMNLMVSTGPGAWSASDLKAAAGTEFLVSEKFSEWGGHIILSDGAAAQIEGDFFTGLVLDKDFTSSCATDLDDINTDNVLLQESSFYQNENLSGEACNLPAGTVFSNFSFSGGDVAQLNSETLEAACGFASAYTDNMVYADLVTNPSSG